jgi:hypothetical protein
VEQLIRLVRRQSDGFHAAAAPGRAWDYGYLASRYNKALGRSAHITEGVASHSGQLGLWAHAEDTYIPRPNDLRFLDAINIRTGEAL